MLDSLHRRQRCFLRHSNWAKTVGIGLTLNGHIAAWPHAHESDFAAAIDDSWRVKHLAVA